MQPSDAPRERDGGSPKAQEGAARTGSGDSMNAAEQVPAELVAASEAAAGAGLAAGVEAWKTLREVGEGGRADEGERRIAEWKRAAGMEGDALERLLLWHACREALRRVDALKLDAWVRASLIAELKNYHAARGSLECGEYLFVRAAEVATLRRFPAGCVDFVTSGIPRSWFPEAGLAGAARMAWYVATRLGGLKPFIFLHVAPYPKNRALVLEKEVMRAYHRMARSLELQPEMRGILGHAWFYDPAALKDYPHLEPLNRPFVSGGGTVITLGPAPRTSGVLEGDASRKKDYLEGKLRYRYGLAIWPRAAAVRWAKEHPEYG